MASPDEVSKELQTLASLDDCHCCDVSEDPPVQNRPGLRALQYRVGSYATFFQRMKAQLSTMQLADGPQAGRRPLAALTTRSLDDPSIALLDAAAVLADILTFYQERIANEGFLRTATERASVLELARQIGYELGPGVAASTYLAFLVDEPVVHTGGIPFPTQVPLAAGIKVQSVPGPGQAPQTFETTEPIVARVTWNALRLRTTQRQELAVGDLSLLRVDPQSGQAFHAQTLWLDGITSNVRVGDLLYVSVGPAVWDQDPVLNLKQGVVCVFAKNVEVDYTLKRTRVDLDQTPDPTPGFFVPPQSPGLVSLDPLPLTLENVRKHVVGLDWDEDDLRAYLRIQQWDERRLLELVTSAVAGAPPAAEVFVFRQKTGMFGNNAPAWRTMHSAYLSTWPDTDTNPEPWPNSWDDPPVDVWSTSSSDPTADTWLKTHGVYAFLDRTVPLPRGSLIALANAIVHPKPYMIDGTLDVSVVDFAISSKVTGVSLKSLWSDPSGDVERPKKLLMRNTSAYVQSEPVMLADAPIDEPVGTSEEPATSLVLDRMVLGFDRGQKLVLTGVVAAKDKSSGSEVSELCELSRVVHSRGYTILHFKNGLKHSFVRNTVVLNGNVAQASHGETQLNDLLGSGNASVPNQSFQLAKSPLTYVPAPNARGSTDTLTVRVEGVAWREVPTLYGQGPNEPVFTVRHTDSGAALLRFGDGNMGSRLPSGSNNLVATYRAGLGPEGNVEAGTIAILQSRPYALKSARNPLPATGGAPPEQLRDARQNAPRTVRTLERVVSLSDFTDFARGFAGVGKALAVPLWNGETQVVHLSVAASSGGHIDPSSLTWKNLIDGLHVAGDGSHAIRVDNFQQAFFKLKANIVVDKRRVMTDVVKRVSDVIVDAFSFWARELAQTVTESEIIAHAQSVSGVVAVEVIELYRADAVVGVGATLPAKGAHFANGKIVPAELLLLHPAGFELIGVAP